MKRTAAFLTAAAMTVGLFYSLAAWADRRLPKMKVSWDGCSERTEK